jgi:hypothetical protein
MNEQILNDYNTSTQHASMQNDATDMLIFELSNKDGNKFEIPVTIKKVGKLPDDFDNLVNIASKGVYVTTFGIGCIVLTGASLQEVANKAREEFSPCLFSKYYIPAHTAACMYGGPDTINDAKVCNVYFVNFDPINRHAEVVRSDHRDMVVSYVTDGVIVENMTKMIYDMCLQVHLGEKHV